MKRGQLLQIRNAEHVEHPIQVTGCPDMLGSLHPWHRPGQPVLDHLEQGGWIG